MPTYISPKRPSHNQATIGQLAAIGTSPQCSWAGARGKEGLESQGCEVSHLEPYRILGVSDCPRPSLVADSFQLVSAPAAGAPSCRRPSPRSGEGATPEFGGVAAQSGSQFTYVCSGTQRSTPPVRQSSLVGGPAGGRRSAPDVGFRALRAERRCLKNTPSAHHSPRGLPIPGGDRPNAPPPALWSIPGWD